MTTARTKITAKVERIVFPKADAIAAEGFSPQSFYILKCDVGTVKGRLAHTPKTGETLVLDGQWEVSKYNGKPEFSFFHASLFIPTDERAMLRYACEMTKGFGPSLEGRIWDALGERWRDLSDGDLRGVSPSMLAAFHETISFIDLHGERTKTVAWLVSIGLTVKMAEAAFEMWGASTTARVQDDPYILAKLPNHSFADADSHIRKHFEITRDDRRRISAALKYYLAQLTQEDTIVSWDELYAKVSRAIDSTPNAISDVCRSLFDSGRFIDFPEIMSIASSRNYEAEKGIYMFAIDAGTDCLHTPRRAKARQPIERDFDLDEMQMSAVQFALDSSFSIINGGAGTGKTSLVRAICDSLHGRLCLCSFAGKAAARLREATGHGACTIHRLLGWQGEARGFTVKSLEGETVVMDEASMVSSDLMWEVVKRRPERIVLVGDEAQLPPVGSGQPFHDLIALMPDCVRTLSVCYRNSEAVFTSALAVRQGMIPPPNARSASELYDCVSIPDPRSAHGRILDLVRKGYVDFAQDIILCCRNGESPDEPCSVRALNADIKAIVNPEGGERIVPGDRIICTKNSSDLDVWNGTTGSCRAYDTAHAMWVDLDFPNESGETCVLIPRDKVKDWTLAYALTVHKAQGSQYRKVFFLSTRRDAAVLLDRPMVYTAITRAKQECHIIGDMGAYSRAISTLRSKRTVMQELSRQLHAMGKQ